MRDMTHSESLFQAYLDLHNFRWEREPVLPGKAKRPDYLVHLEKRLCWFEVKEFNDPKVKPTGGFSPCPPIAKKIEEARKQFKEYKSDCCALVLHNCTSVYRNMQVHTVLSAAFGERVELEPSTGPRVHDDPPRFKFRGRSRLNPKLNTSVSAIAILEHYELQERLADAFQELRERYKRGDEPGPFAFSEILQERNDFPGVITYSGTVRIRLLRNPFARYPFPDSIFRGPFDQHWGIDKDSGWFSLLWMGNELNQLRNRTVPVPFWLL
jgi:hypothetical protein